MRNRRSRDEIKDRPFFCSWSGGKDSALALHRAVREGGQLRFLLTMLTEDGQRSRSHGLPIELIRRQAREVGIPLMVRTATWEEYEAKFVSAIEELGEEGVEVGVFGDIDIEDHRAWVERVCSSVGIGTYLPLWRNPRPDLLADLIRLGFEATIVVVKDGVMDRRFLGRRLSLASIRELADAGIDASGEQGEYHTVVTDGPIFASAIPLVIRGQVLRDGYWFLNVSVAPGA